MGDHLKVLSGAIVILFAFAVFVLASSPGDITYPIAELGECADEAACREYCDDFGHKDACLDFARLHKLLTEEEIEEAEDVPEAGPGGCTAESECRAYCEEAAHFEECSRWGIEHGFTTEAEVAEHRKFLEEGGPGGCQGGEACRTYCDEPAHHNECIDFAAQKGILTPEEAAQAKKLAGKIGPGGCRGEAECRSYCNDPTHLDLCLAFAEAEGFVSPEEAKRLKKAGFTTGPGGCKGEQACRQFCENPTNQLACIDWAVQNGFMTEEEARMSRKFAGKTGPGGCQGEQCREYCENPANVEACLEFAAQEGLLPPGELERARKFVSITKEGGPGGCRSIQCKTYCGDPAHQDECFDFAKRNNLIPPEAEKDFEAGKKIRQKMIESGGPGGCRTDGECRAYCTEPAHVEECVAFGAAHGGVPPEEVRRMLREFTAGRFEARGEFGPSEDFRRFEEEARKRFQEFRALEEQFRGKGFPEGFGPPGGFPGAPGEFPGAPPGGFPGGGPAGGPGFVGPGGCTSPSECIKYCSEHKEECFSFGPPGMPQFRPPEGGIPPGHEEPRLRQGLIQPAPESKRAPTAGGTASIRLEPGSSGLFILTVRASVGVQEFSLTLASGSSYGGGVGGCPREFVNDRVTLRASDFPITASSVTDCNGTTHALTLGPPYGAPVLPPAGVPAPPEFPRREALPLPPEGFKMCPAMPTVDTCPPGQHKVSVYSSPECGTYYACVPEIGLPPPPPPPEDPIAICAAKGGTWDGQTCRFPNVPPPPPPPPPPPTSGDPATLCSQQGGTWDGATCRFPTKPSSGLEVQHGAASLLRGLWSFFGF